MFPRAETRVVLPRTAVVHTRHTLGTLSGMDWRLNGQDQVCLLKQNGNILILRSVPEPALVHSP